LFALFVFVCLILFHFRERLLAPWSAERKKREELKKFVAACVEHFYHFDDFIVEQKRIRFKTEAEFVRFINLRIANTEESSSDTTPSSSPYHTSDSEGDDDDEPKSSEHLSEEENNDD
jgi:hypothetical protein